MNNHTQGKLIVIDGTDGSGKATQIARLKERLETEEYSIETLDFPRYYDNFFGGLIGEALKGDFGDWSAIHPKVASILYANDRAESKPQILKWLSEGKTVLLDRYVSSNQIHQGGKIHDEAERKAFLGWLDTLEHEVLGLPRPDLILYLDVSVAVTQDLLVKKGNKESKKYLEGRGDQHETNIPHLEDARASGLKMISQNNNWVRIVCTENETILPIETIHNSVYQEVKKILV